MQQGIISAPGINEFLKSNVLREKPKRLTMVTKDDIPHEGPFGRKSDRSEVTVARLVEANYTTYDNEEDDYPDMSGLAKFRKLPKIKRTKASRAHARVAKEIIQGTRSSQGTPSSQQQEGRHPHFVMSRFKNVKGKLGLKQMIQQVEEEEKEQKEAQQQN